jgi:hypothetical protein
VTGVKCQVGSQLADCSHEARYNHFTNSLRIKAFAFAFLDLLEYISLEFASQEAKEAVDNS